MNVTDLQRLAGHLRNHGLRVVALEPEPRLHVTNPLNGLLPQKIVAEGVVTGVREKPRQQRGERAYRAWLGHTQHCPTCRTGTPCPTATKLGHAWREERG